MTENRAEYVATRERQRALGLELDALLDKRAGFCHVSRAMTYNQVSPEQRDGVLAAYTREVAELDSEAGRLRFKIEQLEVKLDTLAGVYGDLDAWHR